MQVCFKLAFEATDITNSKRNSMNKQEKEAKKAAKKKERERRKTRTCGGCRACCHVFPLGDKPKREWCKHVTPTGCGCHADPNRPKVCRDYRCVWLDSDFPESLRPDRSGCVVTPRTSFRGYRVVGVSQVWDGAMKSSDGRTLMAGLEANGAIVLVFHHDGRINCRCRHLGLGPDIGPALHDHIVSDSARLNAANEALDFDFS